MINESREEGWFREDTRLRTILHTRMDGSFLMDRPIRVDGSSLRYTTSYLLHPLLTILRIQFRRWIYFALS